MFWVRHQSIIHLHEFSCWINLYASRLFFTCIMYTNVQQFTNLSFHNKLFGAIWLDDIIPKVLLFHLNRPSTMIRITSCITRQLLIRLSFLHQSQSRKNVRHKTHRVVVLVKRMVAGRLQEKDMKKIYCMRATYKKLYANGEAGAHNSTPQQKPSSSRHVHQNIYHLHFQ